ncbi:MAG: tyrosine-type recombinase/integrase [Terriglobales bacterium]
MRARRRALEEGAAGVRRPARPKLFAVAAEEWLIAQAIKWSPATAGVHRLTLRHLLPVFGEKLACDIESQDVSRYQTQRLAAGASKRRINMEVGTLRSVLKKCRRWAVIAEDVKLFPEDYAGKGRKLTAVEQTALLHACGESRQPALLPFVVLALETGARFDSIRTLVWGRVNFESRAMQVGHDKTPAGTGRVVPLSRRAMAALEHWAAQFPARRPEDYVFPAARVGGAGRHGLQGGREDAQFHGGLVYAIDPSCPVGGIKSAWEAAKGRCGLACRFHDLRHTAASAMMERSVPLAKIAKILGWRPSTMALMAARYGHFTLDDLRSAVEPVGPAVAGSSPGDSHQFSHQFSGPIPGASSN